MGLSEDANTVCIPGLVLSVMSMVLSAKIAVNGKARRWFSLGISTRVSIGLNMWSPSSPITARPIHKSASPDTAPAISPILTTPWSPVASTMLILLAEIAAR